MSRNLPKFDLWHFSVCLLVFSELNLRFNGIRKFSRITVLVEAVITWKQNWSWKSSIISRHPWFYPHFRGLKRYHLKGVIYNKFRFRFVFLPGAIFSEKCSRACVKQDQQNSPYSCLTVFFTNEWMFHQYCPIRKRRVIPRRKLWMLQFPTVSANEKDLGKQKYFLVQKKL